MQRNRELAGFPQGKKHPGWLVCPAFRYQIKEDRVPKDEIHGELVTCFSLGLRASDRAGLGEVW